ncbi:hypothetical protein Hanom_Chr08g00716141 [Helianthus anomalus]
MAPNSYVSGKFRLKKTPRQEGSSSGFPKVPSNRDAGPTGLEDFGDFFNDAKVNELSKKVAGLEKSKVEQRE